MILNYNDESSIAGHIKEHREVFLLELIRNVTDYFVNNLREVKDVADVFDLFTVELLKNIDTSYEKEIISLFDKNFKWITLFDVIKDELKYYSSAKYETAKKLFEDLQDVLDQFPDVNDLKTYKFFPKSDFLKRYLDCYYSTSRFIFENSNLLYEEYSNKNGSVETFGELLTHVPAQKNCSIYSPYCAEALLTLYDSLPILYQSNLTDIGVLDDFVYKMINSAFSVKAFRRFRHFVIHSDRLDLLSCENTDRFLEKRSENLSSYELIRPVRLFGKIKRHSRNVLDENDVLVTIVGAVYIEINNLSHEDLNYLDSKRLEGKLFKDELKKYSFEMFQLCNWLRNDSVTKEKKFIIEVYLNKGGFPSSQSMLDKTIIFHWDKIEIRFIYENYKSVSSRDFFEEKIISDNQLLLILDCPFLYEPTRVFLDNSLFSDYFDRLPERYSNNKLSLSDFGTIQKIQMQINMQLLGKLERTGHFERRLREPFLEFLSKRIEKKKNSEAFVFISSHRSVITSKYINKYNIRTEKYNGKEISLFRFGKELPSSFQSKDKESNSIAFSLWNIIVNTDVSLISAFQKRFNLNDIECLERLANRIIIELKWINNSNIFDSVCVNISEKSNNKSSESFLSNERSTQLKKCIHSYFDVLFNTNKILSSVLNCMQNSFFNVFFSKIDNMYEIIAYQRLREKLARSEGVIIKNVNVSEPVIYDDNTNVTQYKKLFVDVVSNLSLSRPSESVRDILVDTMKINSIDAYDVYDDILQVCENIGLVNSDLYKNTRKARSIL